MESGEYEAMTSMEIETLADSIRRKVAEVQAEQAAARAAEQAGAGASELDEMDSPKDGNAAGCTLNNQLRETSTAGRRSFSVVPVVAVVVLLVLALVVFYFGRAK